MEIWKDIKGYEGFYMVSSYGQIAAKDRMIGYRKGKQRKWKGQVKKPTETDKGYLKITLFKNGKGKTREIQRLVAEAFIPNPEGKEQVNHIDGNKKNNHVENLEWTTPLENTRHSIEVLGNNHTKTVFQKDLKGNVIAVYSSEYEAAAALGIKPCGISNVINGRRITAGGYKWELMNDGKVEPIGKKVCQYTGRKVAVFAIREEE